MPFPGVPELLIILVIFILLFGATRLPKLARSTGQAIREFRAAQDAIPEGEGNTNRHRDS